MQHQHNQVEHWYCELLIAIRGVLYAEWLRLGNLRMPCYHVGARHAGGDVIPDHCSASMIRRDWKTRSKRIWPPGNHEWHTGNSDVSHHKLAKAYHIFFHQCKLLHRSNSHLKFCPKSWLSGDSISALYREEVVFHRASKTLASNYTGKYIHIPVLTWRECTQIPQEDRSLDVL